MPDNCVAAFTVHMQAQENLMPVTRGFEWIALVLIPITGKTRRYRRLTSGRAPSSSGSITTPAAFSF